MSRTVPEGFEGRRVERLLEETKAHTTAAERVGLLSARLLGQPFESNGLIGSKETPEVFTASLSRFDCVTYIETVLALSLSSRATDFVDWLRRIRYEDGRIEWERRNHYMTSWIESNERLGAVRRVPSRVPANVKKRRLSVVPGLPPLEMRFACVPKPYVARLGKGLETGDLIFFASTRKDLDVFHCGILVKSDSGILLRHAARSRKQVVEEDLRDFLRANRMSGVIVVRPSGARAA